MSSIRETLAERHSTHGDYHEQAELSQALQDTMRTGANWLALTKVQREDQPYSHRRSEPRRQLARHRRVCHARRAGYSSSTVR